MPKRSLLFRLRRSAVAALLCIAVLPKIQAGEVWVFTAEGAPELHGVARADRHFVFHRDNPSLAALRFPNPGSPETAQRMALAQIRSPEGKALMDRIRAASEARLIALMYGIDKLPAVLVDGDYVVYGARDVQAAVDSIAAYRRRQGR